MSTFRPKSMKILSEWRNFAVGKDVVPFSLSGTGLVTRRLVDSADPLLGAMTRSALLPLRWRLFFVFRCLMLTFIMGDPNLVRWATSYGHSAGQQSKGGCSLWGFS
jgi:hypothetical protein